MENCYNIRHNTYLFANKNSFSSNHLPNTLCSVFTNRNQRYSCFSQNETADERIAPDGRYTPRILFLGKYTYTIHGGRAKVWSSTVTVFCNAKLYWYMDAKSFIIYQCCKSKLHVFMTVLVRLSVWVKITSEFSGKKSNEFHCIITVLSIWLDV